jgi:hypothetical protein
MLKAPGTKRLKHKYDASLLIFGFKFNLRRYTGGAGAVERQRDQSSSPVRDRNDAFVNAESS